MASAVQVLAQQATSGSRAAIDLTAPVWKAHASLTQNDRIGTPLSEWVTAGQANRLAAGQPWKGLTIISGNEAGTSGGLTDPELLNLYRTRTCQADVIVVGSPSSALYHLSASGTGVYGDYDFIIGTLLKDNRTAPIGSNSHIVVTRPGGFMSLDAGPVDYDLEDFPRLQSTATYLLFLRYIPASSGYEAIDPFSTLLGTEGNWMMVRKPVAGHIIPGFAHGEFDTSVRQWLISCK